MKTLLILSALILSSCGMTEEITYLDQGSEAPSVKVIFNATELTGDQADTILECMDNGTTLTCERVN